MNILLLLALVAVTTDARASTREETKAEWIERAIQSIQAYNKLRMADCMLSWGEFAEEYNPQLTEDVREHVKAFCEKIEKIARQKILAEQAKTVASASKAVPEGKEANSTPTPLPKATDSVLASKEPTLEEKKAVWIESAIKSVRKSNSLHYMACYNIWVEFDREYDPKLTGGIEEHYNAFCENVEKIARHNMLNTTTYKQGINEFTHLRPEDFKLRKGFVHSERAVREHAELPRYKFSGANVPDEFDWRDHGVVTDVQNQGQCGSCWAFASVGALVGQYILKHNGTKPFELSEQDLLDCSSDYGTGGCHGGDMVAAFKYVKDHGIDSDSDYPYKGKVGDCAHDDSKDVTKDDGAVAIKQNDEDALKEAVATIGPISVAIIANDNFQSYDGGVYDDDSCYDESMDHAVLVVGYGTDNGDDYWLVKNSWGADWGEDGYIRMARNKKNQCRIADHAVYPKV